jgi:HSP20 family protein
MAESDVQSSIDDAADKAAGAARRATEAGAQAARKGAEAATDAAKAGLDAERRSFASPGAAQSSLRAGQDMARQSQDMARRATDQAADFWCSSLRPMSQLSGEFNRWFEQIWRGPAGGLMQGGLPLAMLSPFTGHPLADLRETDKGYELCVDLPGMKAQDIELTLKGDMLMVSGEKTEEDQGGQGGYRFSERRFGRFERTFALPPGVDRSRLDASFEDGVLKVQIPHAPDGDRGRQIPVRGR